MDFIKVKKIVKYNKIVIEIPENFISKSVEVIIIPADDEAKLNDSLMKVSEKSFNEWDNAEDEIYNSF